MDQSSVSNIMYEAVMTILTVSAPLLIVALVIGVIVSIFQATTQINEQTLVFIPKIVGMLLVLVLLGDWMLTKLGDYTTTLFEQINTIVK
jgi:flagellar biosynthetic protein FliQ